MTLRELPLLELARRCREETLRFLRGEPRDDAFCFEVFERAVAQRDDDAWAAIIAQYRGIVLAYVGQHSLAADGARARRLLGQSRLSALLERRRARSLSRSFPICASLLKYLKLCVHSVLMDEVRARKAAR